MCSNAKITFMFCDLALNEIKLCIFAHRFWCRISQLSSRYTVKRESGENPEQTRCCKLCVNPLAITHYPLFRFL